MSQRSIAGSWDRLTFIECASRKRRSLAGVHGSFASQSNFIRHCCHLVWASADLLALADQIGNLVLWCVMCHDVLLQKVVQMRGSTESSFSSQLVCWLCFQNGLRHLLQQWCVFSALRVTWWHHPRKWVSMCSHCAVTKPLFVVNVLVVLTRCLLFSPHWPSTS